MLGHVGFAEKDAVLEEIRRVLRPEGVTMHGIECIDRRAQKSYDEMTEEELRRFVAVDGHVGLEEEQEHAARFRRFFAHVAWEPRYTLCLSSEEFVKQADEYGLAFERDFLDYLRGLSYRERRAFDMAMGYVFGKISDLHVSLPKSGLYVFLKASQAPLGAFYNEHRDRRALAPVVEHEEAAGETFCLDRSPDAAFDEGWYEPNILPPVARWMRERGRVRFRAPSVASISLDLTSHIPDLAPRARSDSNCCSTARRSAPSPSSATAGLSFASPSPPNSPPTPAATSSLSCAPTAPGDRAPTTRRTPTTANSQSRCVTSK